MYVGRKNLNTGDATVAYAALFALARRIVPTHMKLTTDEKTFHDDIAEVEADEE